jgi:O-antigen ligase
LTVDYAHNDYAEAVAETGLAGATLIFTALALFFHLSFRNCGRRLSSGDTLIGMGAAVGCCGLLVHTLFDFNLHIPANAAWFAVLAGIATTEGRLSSRRSTLS